VSNDGTTWETATSNEHFFTTAGNVFKLKITLFGTGENSPYIQSNTQIMVVLTSGKNEINYKNTQFKLKG
jgi:hypothetical protein